MPAQVEAVWFKRDFRVSDHRALKAAAERGGAQYRSEAERIQERHGSRKSGVRGVRSKRKAPKNTSPLALGL